MTRLNIATAQAHTISVRNSPNVCSRWYTHIVTVQSMQQVIHPHFNAWRLQITNGTFSRKQAGRQGYCSQQKRPYWNSPKQGRGYQECSKHMVTFLLGLMWTKILLEILEFPNCAGTSNCSPGPPVKKNWHPGALPYAIFWRWQLWGSHSGSRGPWRNAGIS